MPASIDYFRTLLEKSQRALFFTGAGISTAFLSQIEHSLATGWSGGRPTVSGCAMEALPVTQTAS